MSEKRDLYNYPRKIELALARVDASEVIPENKASIHEFYEWSKSRGLSLARCLKHIDYSLSLARMAKTPFKDMKRAEVNLILQAIDAGGFKKWSVNDFRAILKQLFRCLRHSDDADPEEVAWFKIGSTHYAAHSEDTVLKDGDVARLIAELPVESDKVLVLTLYWTAARITEALSLRIGDVRHDENGWLLFDLTNYKTNGKKRTVPVADADVVRQINAYIRERLKTSNMQGLLFASTGKAKTEYSPFRQRLSRAIRRSGVTSPANPHAFRHSRLTAWAKAGFGDQQLKYLAGWTQNSDMAAVYIHSDFDMVRAEFSKRYETRSSKEANNAALFELFKAVVRTIGMPENQKAFLEMAKKSGTEKDIERARDVLLRTAKH